MYKYKSTFAILASASSVHQRYVEQEQPIHVLEMLDSSMVLTSLGGRPHHLIIWKLSKRGDQKNEVAYSRTRARTVD